jgi:hypothetical protein
MKAVPPFSPYNLLYCDSPVIQASCNSRGWWLLGILTTFHRDKNCWLLRACAGARRRGLALRTYAVLPLTDDCGILQVGHKAAAQFAVQQVAVWSRSTHKRNSINGFLCQL